MAADRFRPAEPAVAAQQVLGSADIQNLRGVLADDPLRAVQVLPGVTTGDDLRSEFSVRGSDFNRMNMTVDGFSTPYLLHTVRAVEDYSGSGSVAMINSDMLEDVTLLNGGYAAAIRQPHRGGAGFPPPRRIARAPPGARRGQRHERVRGRRGADRRGAARLVARIGAPELPRSARRAPDRRRAPLRVRRRARQGRLRRDAVAARGTHGARRALAPRAVTRRSGRRTTSRSGATLRPSRSGRGAASCRAASSPRACSRRPTRSRTTLPATRNLDRGEDGQAAGRTDAVVILSPRLRRRRGRAGGLDRRDPHPTALQQRARPISCHQRLCRQRDALGRLCAAALDDSCPDACAGCARGPLDADGRDARPHRGSRERWRSRRSLSLRGGAGIYRQFPDFEQVIGDARGHRCPVRTRAAGGSRHRTTARNGHAVAGHALRSPGGRTSSGALAPRRGS